jgi:hypothetical protein
MNGWKVIPGGVCELPLREPRSFCRRP